MAQSFQFQFEFSLLYLPNKMKYLIVLALIAFASAMPQQIGFQYLDEAIKQAQSEQNFESDAVVIDVS